RDGLPVGRQHRDVYADRQLQGGPGSCAGPAGAARTMNFGIAFAPLVPAYLLWAAGIAALLVTALLLFVRSRGALVRGTALAPLVFALANPSFTREDREPIPSVVAVVIDKNPSQNFGERGKQTEEARAALSERLGRIPNLDVRVVEAGIADGETDGT